MNPPLGLLEVAGLIRRAGAQPDPEYTFRHALLRETAYSSLLRDERKQLHRVVGEAIERIYPNANGDLASVLAHHFLTGEREDKAFAYLRKAGDEAARVYAVSEALEHYDQALELGRAGQGEDEDLQYLFERRGRMLELAGQYERALESYEEMEDFGRKYELPRLELRGLVRRANLLCFPNSVMDLDQGEELSQRALSMAEQRGDQEAQCLALWNLEKMNEFVEDYPAALEFGERALELARQEGLRSQEAFILNDLSGVYSNMAHFDEAWEINQQAQDLWQELDNLPMLTDSLCNEMAFHIFQADYDRALEISARAVAISEKIGNLWGQSFSRYFVYWVHFDRGEIERALETARLCLELAEPAGFVVPLIQTQAEIGVMHAYLGAYEPALEAVNRAVENSREQFPSWQGAALAFKVICLTAAGDLESAEELLPEVEKYRSTGQDRMVTFLEFVFALATPEFALASGRPKQALRDAARSSELFDELGIEFVRSDFELFCGLALLEMDRFEEARHRLEEARTQMEEIGARRSLWRALAGLARVEEAGGHHDRAAQLWSQAEETVRYIAAQCPPEYRQSFLESHQVRQALAPRESRG